MAVLLCATDFAPAVDVGLTFLHCMCRSRFACRAAASSNSEVVPTDTGFRIEQASCSWKLSAEPQLVPDKLHSPSMRRLI